jgi:polyisoprenoid-binding protein YceI
MVHWKIDPSHSQIEFAVRHLAISTVRGRFRKFDVTVAVDEDGTPRAIDVVIDANSIDTAEPQRDNHLHSADFLEVTTYPHITFRSTQIDRLGLHRYRVAGDVTIRNETRPLSFEMEASPAITDPWGNRRAAAAATGVLNRKDFGLTYNQVLEFGGLAIGEDVRFTIELEAVAQAAAA